MTESIYKFRLLLSTDTTATSTTGTDDHSTTGADDHSSASHVTNEARIVFFLFSGLLVGGIVREIKKKTGIPYTPMLFMVGILIGFYHKYLGIWGESINVASLVNPHGILLIFLPVLLFESAFNADWHLFKKQASQILVLAGPCVVVSAGMLAVCIKALYGMNDTDIFTWSSAFMFGAILSCTDTVAVIALLKEIGASKKFNSLIEGESLLNDATCMVLLTVAGNYSKGESLSPIQVVQLFAELSIGGILLGVAVGIVCAWWIRKIFNDEVLVVNITFLSCYLLFFAAENVNFGIKISGIIALVALGLFMAAFGRSRISSESDHAVHTFWSYIVYCAETIIFLLAGVIIGNKVFLNENPSPLLTVEGSDYLKVFYLYLCMLVVRYVVIAMFMPMLKNQGYGLTWKEVFVLAYGGLRGAIGISFALIVGQDDAFSENLKRIVVFDMAGAAILTLIINGTTTGPLIKKLGLASTSEIKQRVMISFMEHFLAEMNEYQHELKSDAYLQAADWGAVSELVGRSAFEDLIKDAKDTLDILETEKKKNNQARVRQIFKGKRSSRRVGPNGIEMELLERGSKASDASYDSDNDNEEAIMIEARDRFIMTLKGIYFQLFEVNQCKPDSYILLVESANWDLDNDAFPMNSWDFISNYFINHYYIRVLFWFKTIPIIGSLARSALFKQLSFVYDVVSTYLIAHERVESMGSSFPIQEEVMALIFKESEENRNMAEDYLSNYLNVSFPEITKSIQNIKAAHSILTRQKEVVEETYNRGQIDEKEFRILKKRIDRLVMNLNDYNPDWKQPPLKEFLKKLPFFAYFSDDEISALLSVSREKDIHKDDWVIKEGQKASKLIVITRGVGTEATRGATNTYKEKKGVGSVISMHHIVSTSMRYQTGFLAESMVTAVFIDLSLIKEKMKVDKRLEEYVWRESFYFLTRFHSEELKLFTRFDKTKISVILSEMRFLKIKKDTSIDISQGGIFLRGQAKEEKPTSTSESILDQSTNEPRVLKNLTLILPDSNSQSYYLKAEKTCALFVLENTQEFFEKLQHMPDRSEGRSHTIKTSKTSFIKRSSIGKHTTFHVNTLGPTHDGMSDRSPDLAYRKESALRSPMHANPQGLIKKSWNEINKNPSWIDRGQDKVHDTDISDKVINEGRRSDEEEGSGRKGHNKNQYY